jgi:hypothetical protein
VSRLLVAQRALTVPGWAKDALWRRAQAVPSLDLRLADNKSLVDAVTGASLVTFTRASSGTFVDSAGTLQTAVTNLLLRSEEFDNASWTVNPGSKNVTANTTAAPNGTLTADTVTANGISAAHFVDQTATLTAISYVYTVYAKAGTNNFIQLRASAALGSRHANFDVSTGATGTSGNITSSSIEFVGDGWYRCSMVFTSTAATGTLAIILVTSNSASSAEVNSLSTSVIIWGAQLEQASTVGEYIPTTSAINSAPRFDHNPTTGESLGLLVEEARTNLQIRSEEFEDASYSKTRCSISTNSIAAPNGATTADKLVEDTSTNSHFMSSSSLSCTSGQSYTLSIFAKAGGRDRFRMQLGNAGTPFPVAANHIAIFDIALGSVVSTGSALVANIISYANGWYRCSITATAQATATDSVFPTTLVSSGTTISYTGDGTSGIYIWGAQLEAGAFPTSYIPTTTAAATRAADVVSITGSAFSSWYSQSEGTVFTQYIQQPARASALVAQLSDNSAANRIGFQDLDGTTPRWFQVRSSSSEGSASGAARTAGAIVRHALRIKTNDFRAAYDGILTAQDSSIIPPTVSQLDIGKRETAAELLNGRISRLTFWPLGLADPTLQSITQ